MTKATTSNSRYIRKEYKMDREKAKALLENGILQAYADGKTIEVASGDGWLAEQKELRFDCEPSAYRVKPESKFKKGDLVKSIHSDEVGCVEDVESFLPHIKIKYGCYVSFQRMEDITHVERITKPHTFETAVKACAEHGFDIFHDGKHRKIIGLKDDIVFWVEISGVDAGSSKSDLLCYWRHQEKRGEHTVYFSQTIYE